MEFFKDKKKSKKLRIVPGKHTGKIKIKKKKKKIL